jgi:hypothetical protein
MSNSCTEYVSKFLLHKLNVSHTAAKSVPRLIDNEEMAHHIGISSGLKVQTNNSSNFISTIVNGDEAWVH